MIPSSVREDVQAARPRVRVLLPVRLVQTTFNQQAVVELEFDSVTAGGVRQVSRRMVGPVGSAGVYLDPLGAAVVDLINLYRTLEAEVDGIVKERDELLARALQAEGEVERFRDAERGRQRQREREAEAIKEGVRRLGKEKKE